MATGDTKTEPRGFVPGMTVRLRGGDKTMAVADVGRFTGMVYCVWQDAGETKNGHFPPQALHNHGGPFGSPGVAIEDHASRDDVRAVFGLLKTVAERLTGGPVESHYPGDLSPGSARLAARMVADERAKLTAASHPGVIESFDRAAAELAAVAARG